MNQSSLIPPDLLKKIERSPESVATWRQFLFRCFERNETDVVYTLQVVIKGLEELARLRDVNSSKVPENHPKMAAALIDFAQNPKSGDTLAEIAEIYDSVFNMPEIAKAHNNRASALGRDDSKPLLGLSKSKSLKPPSTALPSPHFGISPSMERPNSSGVSSGPASTEYSRRTQALGSSWPELQPKLEDTLTRIQRRMSNMYGASSVRPLRLPRTIPALQWLDFLENHLSVQFSVSEMKNIRMPNVPEKSLANRDNPVVRAHDMVFYLEQVEAAFNTTGVKNSRTQALSPVMQVMTDHVAEVSEFIRVGRLAEAEAKLLDKSSEALPPEQASTMWSNLGLQYQNRHDNKKALAAYQKSVEFYSDNLQAWFNSGLLLQSERNFSAALQCYRKSTELAPTQAKGWGNLGVLQFEMGDKKNSVESLRKAVEISPDYTRAWVNLATSLCAVEEYRGAERCCQRAMKLNPELPEPVFKLGYINFQLNNLPAAEHNFFTALKLQPGFPGADFYLVVIMARTQRLAEALQICEVAAVPANDEALAAMAWSELGYGYFEETDFETALHCYEKVLEYTPERANAWYEVGIVYHRMGELDEAGKRYQQATQLDPDNIQYWQSLGTVLDELGEGEQARIAHLEVERLSENA